MRRKEQNLKKNIDKDVAGGDTETKNNFKASFFSAGFFCFNNGHRVNFL